MAIVRWGEQYETMQGYFGSTLALAAVAAAAGNQSFEAGCLAFRPETTVWNSTRTQLEFVPAGTTLTFPDNDASCNRKSQVVSVDLCRIALSVPTSNRSSITLELWLPETWTGRTLATGNGGIDGCEISHLPLELGHAIGCNSADSVAYRCQV